MRFDIQDPSLASQGRRRIEWAKKDMPVLRLVEQRFRKERLLKGLRIGCCLHVTTETANLVKVLKAGGAEVRLCASNPLSTQDDVAASLVKDEGVAVYAIKGEGTVTYYRHLNAVLDGEPHLTMDDGADLVSLVHQKRKDLAECLLGGTEETTTGVIRLRSLEAQRLLRYPIIAVNDALTKHLFDNRYGTGQSTIDGIIRATNRLLAGATFVVGGYGYCGRGVAMRARGMGAKVVVTEIDPLRALEANMDGYEVLPMKEAARVGDFFVTVTGCCDVIGADDMLLMKDGAILANSGHFDVELDLKGLRRITRSRRVIRDFVEEFTLKNGRRIYVLGSGRLINLAAAEGHPASVMDMSFANQALSAEYVAKNYQRLEKKVYAVPEDIDRMIARLKLKALGVAIDTPTPKQKKYLSSWEQGT